MGFAQFIGYDDGSSPHFSGAKVLPAISIMFIQFLRLGNLIFPFSTVKPPSSLSLQSMMNNSLAYSVLIQLMAINLEKKLHVHFSDKSNIPGYVNHSILHSL